MFIFDVQLFEVFSQETPGVKPSPVFLNRNDIVQQLGVGLFHLLLNSLIGAYEVIRLGEGILFLVALFDHPFTNRVQIL